MEFNMTTSEWIIIGVILALPFIVLIWAFRKRRRLFWNMRFTSETVWLQFQNRDKRNAAKLIQYQQAEEEQDTAGELTDPENRKV